MAMKSRFQNGVKTTSTLEATGATTLSSTLDVAGASQMVGAVAVGTASAADSKAIMDMVSTTKGMLPPRMTSTQRDAIASPSTGLTIYNTTTNAMNVYNGSSWAAVGSGGGSKNYIPFPDIETNSTSGYSLGTATLTSNLPTGVPTFGSGASGNLTLSAVSSGKLAGNYSLSLASSAATTAGNFIATNAMTLDVEDQAKVLGFKFYYSPTVSASNGNWSGTSSNSFGVAIYDVTNSAWIIPAGVFNLVQSSGVGICQGTFQTPSNMTSFRMVVYNANATAGAITLLYDDFYCGPQAIAFGAVQGDDTAYTPIWGAGFGTVTNSSGYYKRLGDRLIGRATCTTGTAGAGVCSVSLPTIANLDSAKLTINNTTSNPGTLVGKYTNAEAIANAGGYIVTAPATSTSLVYCGVSEIVGTSHLTPSATGASVTASTTVFAVEFEVPIAGWSSNTIQSADTDTRVVAFYGNTSTGSQTSTGNFQQVTTYTAAFDSHAAYSAGNYTVPVSGYYQVSAAAAYASSPTTGYVGISQNSTTTATFMNGIPTTPAVAAVTGVLKCNAGDIIRVLLYQNSGGNLGYGGDTRYNFFSVNRLSGPAVVASSDSVNAEYNTVTAQSLSGSYAQNTIIFTNKVTDSNNSYNASTGIFTCPISGKYLIGGVFNYASRSWATADDFYGQVLKNGSVVKQVNFTRDAAITSPYNAEVAPIIVSCVAGDTLAIGEIHGPAGAFSLSATQSNLTCSISIARIGN